MDMHSDPQYAHNGNALRIWRDVAQNNFQTTKEGRPIFDEVVYVEVISPGSGNSAPVFELVRYLAAETGNKEPKYSTKYEEYKKFVEDFNADAARDASLSGTPLSQWSELNKTQVATMKAQKVFTVEALAALPDTKLNTIGPDGRSWRDKAVAYIENAKNAAYATGLAADLAEEKRKSAALQDQVTELARQMAAMQADKPSKAGKASTQAAPPAEVVQAAAAVDPFAEVVQAGAVGDVLAATETASSPII